MRAHNHRRRLCISPVASGTRGDATMLSSSYNDTEGSGETVVILGEQPRTQIGHPPSPARPNGILGERARV